MDHFRWSASVLNLCLRPHFNYASPPNQKKLTKHKIAIRTIPGISDLAKGNNSITELMELDMEDLLGRVVVEPFQDLMGKNINSKTILITGCAGSIGSELCRQIINLNP